MYLRVYNLIDLLVFGFFKCNSEVMLLLLEKQDNIIMTQTHPFLLKD